MHRGALLAILLAVSVLASSLLFSGAAGQAQQNPVRLAFYVPDDPASLASLRLLSGDVDYVALHWATVGDDAALDLKESTDVIRLVRSLGARPLLSVVAASPDAAHAFLSSAALRASAIDNLVRAVAAYDGICIDFEGLAPGDRDYLTAFMTDLAGRLRPAGKLVSMALSAKSDDSATGWAGALDYAALAPQADLFVVMGYGYRTSRSSVPGSVAPRSWVESAVAYAVSRIPAQKVLLGVPLYGYDWDVTSGPPAKVVRYPDSIALASQYGASIQYDPVQGSAHFSYYANGHSHEVWFEDRSTTQARLTLVARYGLAGFAGWRLGQEDPAVWGLFAPPPTPVPASPTPVAMPPTSGTTWYFAEGSTAKPFDTWMLLQNPGSAPASARLTFMLEGGGLTIQNVLVAPQSRKSIFVNQILPPTAFSTRIDSDQPVYAERAMYAGFDGHDVTAVAAPSTVWYLAEGATVAPFHTWILLQNPNSTPAQARLTYQREDGSTVRQDVLIPPSARASVFANQVIPDSAFSTKIESDSPIVVERAMYRFPGNAATAVTAVASPARNWYFAAGMPTYKPIPADAWLLLQNPNGYPVTATITFYGTDGQTASMQKWLPPASRQSLFASQLFPSRSFGIKVEADGSIIAERSVFLGPSSPGGDPQGAYATQGASQLGTTWVLPEGSTAPPFVERISVLNPNPSSMDARFEFMVEGGQVQTATVAIAPQRAFDFEVESIVRSGATSARVTTSLPSAVERTMYWAKEGKTGAHDTMGIPVR
ncbi:MAG TPA: glycosyl hydrolase family 18 protein [Chloroflexota bacterium]